MRIALTALLLAACGTGASLAACSSSSSGGGGGDDGGADGSQVDGGHEAASADGPAGDAHGDATSGDGASGDGAGGDGGTKGDGASEGSTSDGGSGDAKADGPWYDAGLPDGCAPGPVGEPVDLSCAHLYSDFASKTVYGDVVPYDPGLHLWSDSADKSRWVHLPASTTIDTSDMDEWTFPVGTQFWKEFRLPVTDGGAPQRIETRLLWKVSATTWYRTTYRWSADGTTSATELTGGALNVDGLGYEIPTQDECNSCHKGRKDGVLGFEAVSLSSPGASGLEMKALTTQKLLTVPPPKPLVVPGNAVESAALGYLHANCGTACHSAGGPASFTGFFMRLDVATLGSVQTTSAYTTGWNQTTQSFLIPDAGTSYRIDACDLSSSCVIYRTSRRDGVNGESPGTQMPPLDSHKIDPQGIAAISAWIMESCDAGAAEAGPTDAGGQ
jgi:hypothetical protein